MGIIRIKSTSLLVCVSSGIARRWHKAKNFTLLALCLGNLVHHLWCCLRYSAELSHFSLDLKQWHSNALVCKEHSTVADTVRWTAPAFWLKVLLTSNSLWLSSRYHLHLVYIHIQEHERWRINYSWVRIISDFMYSVLWCNVSVHYNDDCSSYRRNVTEHLYIIQCINRTWIWIYWFIGLLYTIKFLRQKDLTCGMEHLLQKLGSPSKT